MKLATTLLILAVIQIVILWPPLALAQQQEEPEPIHHSQNTTACLEPKAPGLCRGKYLRYAFDNKSGNCISFYYSGCGATQNNFLTYEECRRDCMKRLRY